MIQAQKYAYESKFLLRTNRLWLTANCSCHFQTIPECESINNICECVCVLRHKVKVSDRLFDNNLFTFQNNDRHGDSSSLPNNFFVSLCVSLSILMWHALFWVLLDMIWQDYIIYTISLRPSNLSLDNYSTLWAFVLKMYSWHDMNRACLSKKFYCKYFATTLII